MLCFRSFSAICLDHLYIKMILIEFGMPVLWQPFLFAPLNRSFSSSLRFVASFHSLNTVPSIFPYASHHIQNNCDFDNKCKWLNNSKMCLPNRKRISNNNNNIIINFKISRILFYFWPLFDFYSETACLFTFHCRTNGPYRNISIFRLRSLHFCCMSKLLNCCRSSTHKLYPRRGENTVVKLLNNTWPMNNFCCAQQYIFNFCRYGEFCVDITKWRISLEKNTSHWSMGT